MEPQVTLIVFFTLILACANGANDISKGIATLMGSGITNARNALLWGTVCTVAGGIVAILVGSALIKTFSSGYLADNFLVTWEFLASMILGALLWLILSTKRGWPVSTTHALLGGLIGSALADVGPDGLKAAAIANKAFVPLLISPLLAILLCYIMLSVTRRLKNSESVSNKKQPEYRNKQMTETLHWISGGATCFARGINDVPKIAAILFLALNLSTPFSSSTVTKDFILPVILVTFAMAIGGLWQGRRVLKTLAYRVVPLNPRSGVVANLATTILVLFASKFGLPVSTTHVSTGSLIGIRWRNRIAPGNEDSIVKVLWAWIVTLPVTGIVAAASFQFFKS